LFTIEATFSLMLSLISTGDMSDQTGRRDASRGAGMLTCSNTSACIVSPAMRPPRIPVRSMDTIIHFEF